MHPTRQLPRKLAVFAPIVLAGLMTLPVAAGAQTPAPAPAVTAADYERAARFLSYNVTPLVQRSGVRPTWLDADRFWYRMTKEDGSAEFVVVDVAKVARGIASAGGAGAASPLGGVVEDHSARTSSDKQPEGDTSGRPSANRSEVLSPDGTRLAFIRDFNLWVRDAKTGKETQLTTDGVKDFGYATDNAGWTKSDRPILLWSPDSKKIATFQHDGRKVGEMYLVDTRVGHPKLQAWKYPLPGDEHIFTIQRVIIELNGGRAPATAASETTSGPSGPTSVTTNSADTAITSKVIRLAMDPDPHRSTLCDHIACRGEWADVQWHPDGSRLAFVSSSRDHKQATLRIADAATGQVRTVLDEKVETFYESGNGRINWKYLPASNEIIWFSQRDNWGQLYLHDAQTGALKHQITTGEGNVTQLLRVDEQKRELYFLGMGREKGADPYFRHFYRIGMDGKGLKRLTPEDADHDITLSPSGRYFVDSYSTAAQPAVAVLRDAGGTQLLPLEKADISKLVATGWNPPTPFSVQGRDGVTLVYGLMYRPTNFDPSKKYPIVNSIYPGPQSGSVGSRSFVPGGDKQALAELGFIVVSIDGMGTPGRSKSFHAAYYGDMGDNTLPDQVAAMKALAAKHSWIDLDRAGIYGHSGGGYAAAAAMFRYPDFFKVGVSQAGNHDNRGYEDDWGEKWQGLLQTRPDGTTNYDDQANQNHAKHLKGKLLLAHGTMDANVPPYNTLLVVDALIKANKDFDLILFPNRGHGFGSEPYMVRRRWDYFVKHLLGAEPPREFELKPPPTESRGRAGF
jgi:dipeptidyl-peptidase-4